MDLSKYSNKNYLDEIANTLGWKGNIGYCIMPLSNDIVPSSPMEDETIKKFHFKRKIEFLNGRYCARKALEQLKFNQYYDIAINKNRSPKWPSGIVGSISHSKPLCVAITGLKKNYNSLGVDIENVDAVNSDIQDIIFTKTEIELYQNKRFDWKTLVFSAKESIYKFINPLCNKYIDFKDVDVIISSDNKFEVEFCNPNLINYSISGRYFIDENFVITHCY